MDSTSDRVIEEIRQGRRKISALCGHDVSKFIDYMKGLSRTYAEQVQRFVKEHGPTRAGEAPARKA